MGGGGKGYSAPPPVYTDPVTGRTYGTTQELNDAISAREEADRARAAQEEAERLAEEQRQRDLFNTNVTNAQTRARTNVSDFITARGLNPSDYERQIADMIAASTAAIPDLASNPGSYFSPNAGESILSDARAARSSSALGELDRLFSPTYANTALPDTIAPDVISAILGERFDPLGSQLTNAYNRGMLNPTGYEAAQNRLTTERTNATSTLQSLADQILSNDRGGINDYINQARANANNLSLYSPAFDASVYGTGASDLANRYRSTFGADLRSSLGDTQFTDLTTLLNAGGAVQGATSTTRNNSTNTGTNTDAYLADQILNNRQRGLSSQGAF